jgi:hypothetical protein
MKAFTTAVLVAASAAAFAQQPTPDVTVTGCLTSAQNVYTLTTSDSQPGASAPTTVSYTLQPASNVDLKSHVNHKVEIKGTETAAQDSARVVDSTRSQAPTGTSGSANSGATSNAGSGANGSASGGANSGANNNANSGASGGKTPVVETTTKAQIVAKTLSVSSVRMVAAQCDPTAKK